MKLITTNSEVELRPGTIKDIHLLMSFIRSMAKYERLEVYATEKDLEKSLFCENPAACTLIAFIDGKPIAYVVYFFTFATMTGKRGLWLDDLFVDPEFRRNGIGKALMAYMADVAIQNKCERFEWMVLDWNRPALNFYEELGATVLDNWRICRLNGVTLANLARQYGTR